MEIRDIREHALAIGQKLMEIYWHPLYNYIESQKELLESFTGFLVQFENLVFYFGKTHLAIEYFGSERINKLSQDISSELRILDYTESNENFFEQIVGFSYDSTVPFNFPLPPFSEELIVPTNKGFDKLLELGWNFEAQNYVMAMNSGQIVIPERQFARIVNSFFFDADEDGLKTRHIKWIDFIPLTYDNTNQQYDEIGVDLSIYPFLIEFDARYVYPLPDKKDFRFSKLPQINRFIELVSSTKTSETTITSFLSKNENKYILTMAFLAKDIFPQVKCEWQSEVRAPIQPDFFVLHSDGYADIVEFKLPILKSKAVTGRINRKSFSAEINEYISQIRVYKSYFDDPNNRKWFEEKYGFKVHHPHGILIMGRRWDFPLEDWKNIIADYRDIKILTYDDLIDGVRAQFYM